MAAPAAAEDLPADPAERAQAIESLINDLGAADRDKRDAATDALRRIGLPALKALEKAAESENARLRFSSRKIAKDVRLGITPDWPAHITLLARYYDRMPQLDRRREVLRRICDRVKEKAVPLLLIAMASDKPAEAECGVNCLKRINTESVCRAIVRLMEEPKNPYQIRALALARARLGQEFDARHVLDAGPVDESTQKKMVEAGVRQLLEQLAGREYEEVAEYAGRFAKAAAFEPRFLYIQAEALAGLHREDQAAALCRQALALNPEEEAPHEAAAEMLIRLGRRRLAAGEWQAILKTPPEGGLYDIDAHLRLAGAYEASGLFEKAADALAGGLAAYRKARAAGLGVGYTEKKIRVARWGLIDGHHAAMTRAERGDSVNLVVEALDDHPEFKGEVVWNTLDDKFDLPLYLDPALGPTGPPRLAAIRVSPFEVWLPMEEQFQFKAALVDQYGNPFDGKVEWTASPGGGVDPGMFYGGSRYFDAVGSGGDGAVDESGLFTGSRTGLVTVAAVAVDNPAITGSARLGVGHVPAIIPAIHAPLRMHSAGDLDRVRIYRRALTPEEIADHAAGNGLNVKDEALLGNWDFEKQTYGAYRNTVGLGLAAKVVGEVEQAEEDGRKFVRLNGKGFLEVPEDRSLNFSKACTIETWVRATEKGFSGRIVSKFRTDWWGFLLEMDAGGLRLRCMGDLLARYTMPRNEWTYIAAVMGGNGMLQIYVNGKLLKEQKPHAFIVYY